VLGVKRVKQGLEKKTTAKLRSAYFLESWLPPEELSSTGTRHFPQGLPVLAGGHLWPRALP